MNEFEEIYQTYFKDVYLYILKLSKNEHIAEDITSECFFKVMRSIKDFRGECDLRVWLCQIAKNCYYSYTRKAGQTEYLEDIELAPKISSKELVEAKVIQATEAMLIQQILHELPESYKEVFMWRVYAELSFAQIGQLFGKSDNWACVTYHRARNIIRKRLEEIRHEK